MTDSNVDAKPDDKALTETLTRLLYATARTLYRASLMGVPCEAFDDLKLKVNIPRQGDWALEVTHFSRPGTGARGEVSLSHLGRVVRIAEDKGGRAYYVESVDGRLMRWMNTDIIRVFEDPYGEPSDEERLAWVAAAERRHGLANLHGGAVIK